MWKSTQVRKAGVVRSEQQQQHGATCLAQLCDYKIKESSMLGVFSEIG